MSAPIRRPGRRSKCPTRTGSPHGRTGVPESTARSVASPWALREAESSRNMWMLGVGRGRRQLSVPSLYVFWGSAMRNARVCNLNIFQWTLNQVFQKCPAFEIGIPNSYSSSHPKMGQTLMNRKVSVSTVPDHYTHTHTHLQRLLSWR